MKTGVLWKSFKADEKRYPLFWKHINQLSKVEAKNLYFKAGYPNFERISHPVQTLSRKEIFNTCDLVILIKPDITDYLNFRPGQIIWGWTHTVQGFDITNTAIKNKVTLIGFANMYKYHLGVKKAYVFSRNNELAGFSAVNHFMALKGHTAGIYGEHKKVAIIGFGSAARGAIQALRGLGSMDITVYSKRSKFEINNQLKRVQYTRYEVIDDLVLMDGEVSSKVLLDYVIIINCILQNPTKPFMFLKETSIKNKQPIIIDVSCDEDMGFDFAKPTTFKHPIIETSNYIYYAVDHAPSYYWEAASYEISGALMPYLKHVIQNGTYEGNITLEKALDIHKGHIINPKIITFQNRVKTYPHKIKT